MRYRKSINKIDIYVLGDQSTNIKDGPSISFTVSRLNMDYCILRAFHKPHIGYQFTSVVELFTTLNHINKYKERFTNDIEISLYTNSRFIKAAIPCYLDSWRQNGFLIQNTNKPIIMQKYWKWISAILNQPGFNNMTVRPISLCHNSIPIMIAGANAVNRLLQIEEVSSVKHYYEGDSHRNQHMHETSKTLFDTPTNSLFTKENLELIDNYLIR